MSSHPQPLPAPAAAPSLATQGRPVGAGDPAYFTVETLAAYLDVPVRTVQKWAVARRLPGLVKVGKLLRFRRNDVERQLLTGDILLPKAEKRAQKPRRTWG